MSRPRNANSSARSTAIAPLVKGFKILEAFRPDDPPLRNQDLARRTGLPPSTVSRITASLVELGYLAYDLQGQSYYLTPLVLKIDYAFRSGINVRETLRPGMVEIAQSYSASVALGSRSGKEMIYIDHQRGQSAVRFRFDVGSSVPIARSAMGWAYMAGLDRDSYREAEKELRQLDGDLWERHRDDIERAREEVRTRGFCISMGVFESGVHTVGAPVFIRPGGTLYSVTCGAPAYQLSEKVLVEEIGPRLAWLASSARRQSEHGD